MVVKNNEKLMKGKLNVKNLLNIFIKQNYLKPLPYIQNIQLGIEISSGYGAIKFNQFDINLKSYASIQENEKIQIYY